MVICHRLRIVDGRVYVAAPASARRASPMSDLESVLDRIYMAPLADFVAVRNEAVKELKAEGRKEDAVTVKAMRKPSMAAWTVNQLSFTAPEELGALAEANRELAEAHGKPDADLPGAIRARRERLDRLMELARDLWERSGHNSTKDQLRRLSGTLEAATQPGADPLPGRLSTDLEPAGFGALAGLHLAVGTPSGPSKPRGGPHRSKKTKRATRAGPPNGDEKEDRAKTARAKVEDPEPSDRARASAERALEEARERLERLERLVARAEADAGAAQRRVERDRTKLAELEERVEKARAALDESVARAADMDAAAAELRSDRDAAVTRVEQASAALETFRGP